MVATPANCWANTQEFCEPWRIHWDLADGRCWAPLWGPGAKGAGAAPATLAALSALSPVQESPLRYSAPDVRLAAALESELQGALVNALRGWRPRYVTRVRGDLTSTLRALLVELEARSLGYAGGGPSAVLTADGPVFVDPSVSAAGGAQALSAAPLAGRDASGGGYGSPAAASPFMPGAAAAAAVRAWGGGASPPFPLSAHQPTALSVGTRPCRRAPGGDRARREPVPRAGLPAPHPLHGPRE